MIKRTFLATVPTWQALQKSRQLVFNRYQVNLYGITAGVKDTEFTYDLYTEQRINKTLLLAIQSYINGIIDTLRNF